MGTRQIRIELFKVIAQAIAESNDMQMLADQLCQLLTATLELKGCSILILNEDESELNLLASFGLSSSYLLKGPISRKKSLGCTLAGEAIVIKDIVHEKEKLQYPEAAQAEGIAALVAIPIIFTAKTIGSLRLYHTQPWDISAEDVESLFILAELVGMALRFTSMRNTLSQLKEIISDII